MPSLNAENIHYPDFPIANVGEEQLLGPKITDLLSKKPTTDPEADLAKDPNAKYTIVLGENGATKDDIVIVNHTNNRTTTFEVDPETNLERLDNPVKKPEKWRELLRKDFKPGQTFLLRGENKAFAVCGIGSGKEAHYNLVSKYTNQEEYNNGERRIKADTVDADTIWKTMDPNYAKGHILIDAKGTKDVPTYRAARLAEAVVRADRAERDYSEVAEGARVKMVRDRVGEIIKAKDITVEADRAKALEAILPKNFTAKFERDKDSPYLLVVITHKDNERDSYGGKLVFKVDDLGSDIKPNPRIPAPDKLIQEIYVQSFDTKIGINKDSPADLVKILPLIRPNAKPVETPPDKTQYSKEVERKDLLNLRDKLYDEYTKLNNKYPKTDDEIRKIRQIENQLGNLNNAVNVERGTLSPEDYDNKVKEQFEKNIVELGYTNADAKLFENAGYDPDKLILTVEEAIKKAKTKADEEKDKRIAAEEAAKKVAEEKEAKIKELEETAARKEQEYIEGLTAQQKITEAATNTLQEQLDKQAKELAELKTALAQKDAEIKNLEANKTPEAEDGNESYPEMIIDLGKPITISEIDTMVMEIQKDSNYDPKDPENIRDLNFIKAIFGNAAKNGRPLNDRDYVLIKYYIANLDSRRRKKQ